MATSGCSPAADDAFGPWAGDGCRGGFDFTLRFEESILALPILCIFISALPFRLLQVAHFAPKARTSFLLWLKLTIASFHAALQLAVLIIWCRDLSLRHTRTTIPTCTLAFIAALGVIPLSASEHYRSLCPSFLLEVFLLLSLLFETARARTIWLLDESQVIAAVFTCTVALKTVMFVLESVEKRSLLLPAYQDSSVEATSGTISRAFLSWLRPLLWTGYRGKLGLCDMVTLDDGLSIDALHDKFQAAWDTVPNKKANGALLVTWFTALGPALLAPAFPRLCLSGFTYAQPFLLTEAITLAALPAGQPYNNYSYGLIVAFIFVYFGLAFSTVKYEYRAYRAAVVSRASLVPCLFEKTLRLSIVDTDSKAALTLFSTDMETITRGIAQMHEIWASLLELGIAMWLLERQLGVSTVIPISVVIATMIFGGIVAAPTGKAQAAWIQASQKRVSSTSYIISRMKWIRLTGLTSSAFQRIRELRVNELRISEKYRSLLTWVLLSSSVAPLLVPLFTYVTYALLARRNGDLLSLARAFTSFSLFVLLIKPLGLFVTALPTFASSAASIGRVQEYLNRPEKDATSHTIDNESIDNIKETKDGSERLPVQDSDEKRHRHSHESSTIISATGLLKWPEAETTLLNIRHVEIQRDTFTMILGPVACGKSTLLKVFLGEMPLFKGELEIHSQGAAYCAQEPFIPSRTCREVVLGNTPYDVAWYSRVIKACILDVDFQQWPQGDESRVGNSATSLSGGQKQRLALARAVYSRKELVILDDSLTGLDFATESQIFQNLFGPEGLLRASGHTVILATSSPRYAAQADQVLLLGSDGSIIDKGSFGELHARSAALASLALPDEDEIQVARRRNQTSAVLAEAIDPKVSAALIQSNEEELMLNRPVREASVYGYYLGSIGQKNLIIFAICLLGLAFFDTFPTVWLKWWAEDNTKEPNAHLNKWLGGYAGFTAGGIIAVLFGSRRLFIKIITHTGVVLHDRLVQAVSRAASSFLSSVDTGVTVNRFSQDLQLIDMQLPIAAFGTIVAMAYAIGQTIIVSVASRYFIIAVAGLMVVFYFIQHFYLRTSRQVRYLDIELKAPLYSQLIEISEGLASIRAFGYEAQARVEHRRILNHSQRAIYTLYCLQRWLILTVDVVIAILAVILAAITVSMRKQNGAGNVGLALVNLLGLTASVRAILLSWVTMEIALGAVSRIRSFVEHLRVETSGPDLEEPPKDWPSLGDIEVKDVSASYDSSTQTLKGISLSICHGQKIALCGRTGSGKSSLLLAFLRMLDLDQGSITIDGLDISKLNHNSVRSQMVAVPQEAFILDGTVRQNLDPLNEHNDEQIVTALQKCCLQDVIETLGGLESEIFDNCFSHGQRQLFGVCRALLRNSRIIIMDEPNSGLDSDKTNIVNDLIASWSDTTVIVALHKLNSIMYYDRIAVLDQGRLVAFDSPQHLRQADGDLFRDLFRAVEGEKDDGLPKA